MIQLDITHFPGFKVEGILRIDPDHIGCFYELYGFSVKLCALETKAGGHFSVLGTALEIQHKIELATSEH